jgi:AcrR family transcriptional regulator
VTSRPAAPGGDPTPGPAEQPGTGRARPLPPDERRAKLIAATVPLLAKYGPKVTTRQIAEAAGVAEGTIFRVFPHKDGLVRVALTQALDPAPTIAELLAIDVRLPLRERLVAVTEILQRRLIQVFELMVAARLHGPPPEGRERHNTAPRHEQILNEIVRLLEPDRDQFRCPVPEVVRVLRLLTFAGSHPMISDGHLLTAEEIASVVLDGTRRQPRKAEVRGKDTC